MKAQSWLISYKISGVQSGKSWVKEMMCSGAPGSSFFVLYHVFPQEPLYFALKEAP